MTEEEQLTNIDYGLIAWNLTTRFHELLELFNQAEVKMTLQQALELHRLLTDFYENYELKNNPND